MCVCVCLCVCVCVCVFVWSVFAFLLPCHDTLKKILSHSTAAETAVESFKGNTTLSYLQFVFGVNNKIHTHTACKNDFPAQILFSLSQFC